MRNSRFSLLCVFASVALVTPVCAGQPGGGHGGGRGGGHRGGHVSPPVTQSFVRAGVSTPAKPSPPHHIGGGHHAGGNHHPGRGHRGGRYSAYVGGGYWGGYWPGSTVNVDNGAGYGSRMARPSHAMAPGPLIIATGSAGPSGARASESQRGGQYYGPQYEPERPMAKIIHVRHHSHIRKGDRPSKGD